MTLQYRADTGALLYIASTDALMAECCCTRCDGTCTGDNLLHGTYTVTIADMTGNLAHWNAAWTVTWEPVSCIWSITVSGKKLQLYRQGESEYWVVELPGECSTPPPPIQYRSPRAVCNPTGTIDPYYFGCSEANASSCVVS